MKIKITGAIKKTNEDMINNMGKSIVGFLINWGVSAGTGFLFQILIMAGLILFIFENIWCYIAGSLIAAIFGIILFCLIELLEYGVYVFYLEITRKEDVRYSVLFSWKNNIKKIILFQILKIIKISLYWIPVCALLFIPNWFVNSEKEPNVFGMTLIILSAVFIIRKMQIYNLGFYIIHDNPEVGVFEVYRKIRLLTSGKFWNISLLFLIFLGIILVSLCVVWVGVIIGVPYILILFSNYYNILTEKTDEEY